MQRLVSELVSRYRLLQKLPWAKSSAILDKYILDLASYGQATQNQAIIDAAARLGQAKTTATDYTAGFRARLNYAEQLLTNAASLHDTGTKAARVVTSGVLTDPEALQQIADMNSRIDATVKKERRLPKIITGERVLRTRLIYDNGGQTMLTAPERISNKINLAQFSWVADGVGGVGHQQNLPFEFGGPSGNRLDYRNKRSQELQYSGDHFDSGAYVRVKTVPTQRLLDKYRVSLIHAVPREQQWMNARVTAAGPGAEFQMRSTPALAPPAVLRRSPDQRLYYQTLVDGKYT